LYHADFIKYADETDILIASAYWSPDSPVLFHMEDMIKSDFRIRIIADITCDIEGSIPSTKKATTIDDPVYDYNPSENRIEKAFSDEANVSQMTVDNLPCELPIDASESFGYQLIHEVLPHLLNGDQDGIIKRATLTDQGKLQPGFSYLQDYVEGI
jgi:alanine dehydrogenase